MLPTPPRPQGTDRAAIFMQWVWDMLTGWIQLLDSPDIRINRTSRGVSLILARQPASAGGTSSLSLNYKGTYNPSLSYNKGDIVRVQTGTSQGVWICVVGPTAPGVGPVFPEPVTTGGTNVWDMWTFGVQASVDCQNGNKTIYINASQSVT